MLISDPITLTLLVPTLNHDALCDPILVHWGHNLKEQITSL